MNLSNIVSGSILFLACGAAQAAQIYIKPEVGRGEFKFDTDYINSVEGAELMSDEESMSHNALGFTVGYDFSTGFLLEGGVSISTTGDFLGLFDEHRLEELRFVTGYSLKLSEHFYIVPKIGYSAWEFDIEEGAFLNPGEEEVFEYSGQNIFGQLNLDFPINEKIHLQVSHMRGAYDFGDIKSTRFGIKINL